MRTLLIAHRTFAAAFPTAPARLRQPATASAPLLQHHLTACSQQPLARSMASATPPSAAAGAGDSGAGAQARTNSGEAAGKYCDALQRLYTTKDRSEQDEIITKFYAPQATFDDNITRVHGHSGIKVQFHALPKLFRSASWTQEAVDVSGGEGNGGGAQTVNISTKQVYQWGKREIPLQARHSLACLCLVSGSKDWC